MELKELLAAVRHYPLLQSMVLETISDEEWDAYADTLEAAPADEEVMKASREDHPARMRIAFGDAVADQLEGVSRAIESLIDVGQVSAVLARRWQEHVDTNLQVVLDEQEDRGRRSSSLRRKVELILEQRVDVHVAGDLGAGIYGVIFSGPHRHTIVLSAVAEEETEREFRVYHSLQHLLISDHMPPRSFGFRLEYQRGFTPEWLRPDVAPEYRLQEGTADDLATCTLHGEYVIPGAHMSRAGLGAAKGALHEGLPRRDLRKLLRERGNKAERLFGMAQRFMDPRRDKRHGHFRPLPLPFPGAPRVVRGENAEIYVIGRDESGQPWRRWVCSLKVLHRLGLDLADVERVSEAELCEYCDYPLLIEPAEVDTFREVINDSVLSGRPRYVSPQLVTVRQ